MKKIELIVCFSDGTWQSEFMVEIPEHLHQMHDVDAIATWVIDQKYFDSTEKSQYDVIYIGVFNWEINDD